MGLFGKKVFFIILAMLLLLIPCSIFAQTGNDLSTQKCIISGKVSLPQGMKAAGNIHFTLLFSKDNNLADFIAAKDFTIHTGSDSVHYSLEVPSNSDGYINYRYEPGKNIFCYNGFYSIKGTTLIFSKATKLKLQMRNKNNINLQFIKGRKITGKVSIPQTYDNAAFNYSCSVIPLYDNGTPNNLNDDVSIFQAQNNHAVFDIYKYNKEALYSMIVPDITASYRFKYIMEYEFPPNGGRPFINEGYYIKSGVSCEYSKADPIVVRGSFIGHINFSVIEARKIQGKISLSDGKKADSDISLELYNDEGDNPKFVSILKGENSAEYTLYFQDWKRKHMVLVGYDPQYYFGQNLIVSDKSCAKEFDLSKGSINGVNVILPDSMLG